MSGQYVLGIDLGTSGVKTGLLDLQSLHLINVSSREYPSASPQDPEILWNQTLDAIHETAGQLGDPESILAIGLSGQMHGAALYDGNEKLLGQIINWQDKEWSSDHVIGQIQSTTPTADFPELGVDVGYGYSAAILLGIKEKEPRLFERIAHFTLPLDFLRNRLLGRFDPVTDPTNAGGTGVFDAWANRWHEDLIARLGLPFSIFPIVQSSSVIAGYLPAEAARLSGLMPGTPVITGGGDNQMSMLGSGLSNPDSPVLINIGTGAQVSKVTASFRRLPGVDTRPFFAGAFAFVGASLAGGVDYRRLRDQINHESPDSITFAEMDDLAAKIPPGADGLIYCSGPTRQDPNRRKGFLGDKASLESIGHRSKAVMEGVAMELLDGYAGFEAEDRCPFAVGAGKGLQLSRVWSQICSDMLGKPLRVTRVENAVVGAALMAAFGVGRLNPFGEKDLSPASTKEIANNAGSTEFYRREFAPYWHNLVT